LVTLFPEESASLHLLNKRRGGTQPVRQFWKREKYPGPTGIRTQDSPAPCLLTIPSMFITMQAPCNRVSSSTPDLWNQEKFYNKFCPVHSDTQTWNFRIWNCFQSRVSAAV